MTTTPQAALLSDDETDRHLDSVLVASGSALRHFSLPYNVENMRKAMHAHEAAILAKLQATQEPVQAGELPDEREAFEAYARKRGYQRDELDRCRIGIVGPAYYNPNTEMAWQAWQARAALSARKPLTDEKIVQSMRDAGWPDVLVRHVVGAREFTASLASRIGLEVKP